MADEVLPDVVLAGTQKCGTTWLHTCLSDHPDVYVPEKDSINYFDMYYHRGEEWYRDHFEDATGEQTVVGETPALIRDTAAPRRLAETVPEAELLFVLRNPIDRAFSHYWHLKSRGDRLDDEFGSALKSPDFHTLFVNTGLYRHHLDRFREQFPDERIHLFFFDDLVADERSYIRDVYATLGVDETYVPSPIDEKVNEARNVPQTYQRAAMWISANAPASVVEALRPFHERFRELTVSRSEYDEGVPEEIAVELAERFRDDVAALSEYAGRDLSHWLDVE